MTKGVWSCLHSPAASASLCTCCKKKNVTNQSIKPCQTPPPPLRLLSEKMSRVSLFLDGTKKYGVLQSLDPTPTRVRIFFWYHCFHLIGPFKTRPVLRSRPLFDGSGSRSPQFWRRRLLLLLQTKVARAEAALFGWSRSRFLVRLRLLLLQYSYSTVNILFIRDPEYEYEFEYN